MDAHTTDEILQVLRQRLAPVQEITLLSDRVEGYQPDARQASVLLALFEQENTLYLTFIRRASTLRAHSGEIAFPGGGAESVDPSPVSTALREAEEEIGLSPTYIEVLGALHPVFTVVSNYLILPIVAFLPNGLGELRLQKSEVAEVIVVPLRGLADPDIVHTEEWTRNGMTRTVYFYDYGSYRIWGATARILSMLLEILADI